MFGVSHYSPDDAAGRAALSRGLRDTAPIWWVIGLYGVAAVIVAARLNVSLAATIASYLPFQLALIQIGLSIGVLILFVRLALVERTPRPLRRLWEEVRERLRPEIAVSGLLLLAAASVMQIFYQFFKPLIPRMNDYGWDATLANVDRLLFLGHQPWEVLWPVFGNAPVIVALTALYHLWFVWGLIVWVSVAFAMRHRERNLQYFLAHVLMWSVGGSFVATVFASGGPCFYGLLHAGPDPFADLMTHLHAINDRVPVLSLAAQASLWQELNHSDVTRIAGISAFPSLHVAGSVLRTRIAFVHSAKLGVISALATVAIFVATIMLGWHYFVDSIAGAAVALGAWWFAGFVVAWWHNHQLEVPEMLVAET
jgi:hypothetical protein